MSRIAIIDYGSGNLRSVMQAVRAAADPTDEIAFATCADQIDLADRVIFPGQGAMPDCMHSLAQSGMRDALVNALRNKPVFAICIGIQMLFDFSQEGDVAGLGIHSGNVLRFPDGMTETSGIRLKIPQMGWNVVHQTVEHPVFAGVPNDSWFYFVHSYYVAPSDPALTVATTDYGIQFTSAIARDNIFATQFHAEKSAELGLRMLSNFMHWNP